MLPQELGEVTRRSERTDKQLLLNAGFASVL